MTTTNESANPPTKKKSGRPPLNIDPELIRRLAEIQATMIEIASVAGCSVDHLESHFSDIIKKGRESGKCSLRRWQYKMAATNPTMAIWLGKTWLSQRDDSNNAPMYSKIVVERG